MIVIKIEKTLLKFILNCKMSIQKRNNKKNY